MPGEDGDITEVGLKHEMSKLEREFASLVDGMKGRFQEHLRSLASKCNKPQPPGDVVMDFDNLQADPVDEADFDDDDVVD